MILYLLITALTVFMGCFVCAEYKNQNNGYSCCRRGMSRQLMLNRVLLTGIFMILFVLSALRIGIGNDYWTYRQGFLYIMGGDRTLSYEIGFKSLVKLLQTCFGMDNYVVVFGVMAFLTCGFFVKALYDVSDLFVFSFFLFMTNGFYFMSYSNVRYYFAFAVCMYAMKYVFSKEYVKFVLWVLLAATFHKTALLVIPAYLVAYYLKWTRKTVWMIPATCIALWAGKTIVRKLIFVFYPFYEGDLLYDTESVSYVNILKCLAVLLFSLFFYVKTIKGDEKAETFFNLNLFALILYSFGYYIPETSRICYYFVVAQAYLIPEVYLKLRDTKWKYIFIPLILAFIGYFLFFLERGKGDYVMILPYLTWVFD